MNLTFGSLFSGIGGIDLGLERAGWHCSWQVEKDDFCQRVLEKHWPNVTRYGDVKDVGKHNLETVDLIAGGFPCQPHSTAGKRRGADDDRNLWPEYRRIIAELRPSWMLAENVPGIRTTILDDVLSDLENMAYAAASIDLPACAFNAPHIRHRIFVVAYADREREQQQGRIFNERRGWVGDGCEAFSWWWQAEPRVGRVVDGLPHRVDRLRALGNAVVPQVAEFLGHYILQAAMGCEQ